MLISPPAPHTSALQIPTTTKGSSEPVATWLGLCRATSHPTPPSRPPRQAGQPHWLQSEGHAAAQCGQRRVWDPTGVLGLSGAPKPPTMMFWCLLSLLLFTAASGTPVGDQDEDIQVQENFEAERVNDSLQSFNSGGEGMGEIFISFSSRKEGDITHAHVRWCRTSIGSMVLPGCWSRDATPTAPTFGMASPQQTPRRGGWSPRGQGR